MSKVAVLMCMAAAADRELAFKALKSTADCLTDEDAIFFLIDGASTIDEKPFRDMCGRVRVRFFYSARQQGLAAGLNRLIEVVLQESCWDYLARMDADDMCLPGRFDMQRQFLDENTEVDILGGLCYEVDECCNHLRTKSLPLIHEEIISRLPKRNPINHPTVVMRRRVFESGIRYRANVGLVEDWQLWIDCAVSGFRFANLGEVVLRFRRGGDFFKKRGGLRLARAEWLVRLQAMKRLKKFSILNFLYAATSSGLRFCPSGIQSFIYRHLG